MPPETGVGLKSKRRSGAICSDMGRGCWPPSCQSREGSVWNHGKFCARSQKTHCKDRLAGLQGRRAYVGGRPVVASRVQGAFPLIVDDRGSSLVDASLIVSPVDDRWGGPVVLVDKSQKKMRI